MLPLAHYGTACFLCHAVFGVDGAATEEDVLPKWLLRLLDLGNAAADLPNGQIFGYGRRKVPCCLPCNQRMSRDLELPVSAAFQAGYPAVAALDGTLLFLWLAKVYYGTRFRETELRADVADPASPKMLALEDLLARNDYLRLCLLLRPDLLSAAAPPASIFVFRAGVPAERRQRFDFFVSSVPGVDMIAMRVASTFVIAIFGDNGHWSRELGGIRLVQAARQQLVLHAAQCVELMFWFASEVAGHDSFGCFDLFTFATPEGELGGLLSPQFKVERNSVDRTLLNVARVQTTLTRLGFQPGPDSAEVARSGSFPTLLIDVAADELVQATCFEHRCPGIFLTAGWRLPVEAACEACGAGGNAVEPTFPPVPGSPPRG